MPQVVLEPTPTVSAAALAESGLTEPQLQRLAEAGVVSAHPRIVSGAVVFTGTRVPLYNLWDYLEGGDSIDGFLESFPTVRREQAEQAIRLTQGGDRKSEHPL
jgi:uncharacterized protein (DUF433 family)